MGLREYLRQQISGVQPEPLSGSARLAQHAREWKQYEQEQADAQSAAEVEAAKPQPQSLVEELRSLIGQQDRSEFPALNDSRLLEIAAGTTDMPHSTREAVAAILRGHWDNREQ